MEKKNKEKLLYGTRHVLLFTVSGVATNIINLKSSILLFYVLHGVALLNTMYRLCKYCFFLHFVFFFLNTQRVHLTLNPEANVFDAIATTNKNINLTQNRKCILFRMRFFPKKKIHHRNFSCVNVATALNGVYANKSSINASLMIFTRALISMSLS